jgi:large subunit ribosomal protein L35
MPKIKTKSSLKRRFKKTATGKIVMKGSGLRHILSSKTRKQKRRISKDRLVSPSDMIKLKKLMPY